MPLEEVIANIELLKRGIRPVNEDWQKCAIPMRKCMNFIGNYHKDLKDNG